MPISFSIGLVPMKGFGQVGAGFYQLYQTIRFVYPLHESALGGLGVESLEREGSAADQAVAAVRRHAAKAYKSAEFEVTGHSLGAALATIHVAQNSLHPKATIPLICTFGSPLVGDREFASKFDKLFEKLGFNSWRIVNQLDWAPTVPPPLLGFWHVETEYSYNSASSTVISFMCVHALETYLHLLNPKQPLQNQCIWSPRLTATAPSRAQTGPIPAAAALSASTEKQIALPHEGSSTTIPARSKRRKSSNPTRSKRRKSSIDQENPNT
jgi:hypothetical protein